MRDHAIQLENQLQSVCDINARLETELSAVRAHSVERASEYCLLFDKYTAALAKVKELEGERGETRENLYVGVDRDRDDITTPHLATVASNALVQARADRDRLERTLTTERTAHDLTLNDNVRLAGEVERLNKDQPILAKELAERFLRWPLPDSVCADLCATKQGPGRIGTNLLSFTEALKMMEDVVVAGIAPLAVMCSESTERANKELTARLSLCEQQRDGGKESFEQWWATHCYEVRDRVEGHPKHPPLEQHERLKEGARIVWRAAW